MSEKQKNAKKPGTIDASKKKITVSQEVKDKLKQVRSITKAIESALKSGPKTIPEIAKETNLPIGDVTFYLMTLRKKGKVEVGDLDDDDEYYYYKLKLVSTK